LILAIDASGQTAGAALVTAEKVVAEISLNCGYTHSKTLMPLIDHIVRISGTSLSDIDYIACASGPGSFTGLRIGAGCAKGLARGLGKKMVNVPALDALAYNVYERDGYITPIMDARRGEVYAAVYKWKNELTRVTEYMAEKIEVVIERVNQLGSTAVFLGDGVFPHRELLVENGMSLAPLGSSLQRASSVGALALKMAEAGEVVSPRDFKIFYIRKPQAERESEAKNA